MLKILGFQWDEGNRRKCEARGMTIEAIELFFRQGELLVAPDIKHSSQEQRFIAIGRMSNRRPAFIAFTLRNGYIRPISARYMHAKEVQRYEKINAADQE